MNALDLLGHSPGLLMLASMGACEPVGRNRLKIKLTAWPIQKRICPVGPQTGPPEASPYACSVSLWL